MSTSMADMSVGKGMRCRGRRLATRPITHQHGPRRGTARRGKRPASTAAQLNQVTGYWIGMLLPLLTCQKHLNTPTPDTVPRAKAGLSNSLLAGADSTVTCDKRKLSSLVLRITC